MELILLLQEPPESWEVNEIEGLLLVGEETEGITLHPFDHRSGLLERHAGLGYIGEREIHQPPQGANPAIFLINVTSP
jgi:hypothetical protein